MTKKKIDVFDASSSNELDWIRVRADGVKQHYVHKCLLSPLIVDLEVRGYPVNEQLPVEKACHDYGGAVFKDQPRERIRIDCLSVSIFSSSIRGTLNQLASLPERTFLDGEKYYKMHSWLSCIVFTEDQHSMFTHGCLALLEQAEERDATFMDDILKKQKKSKKS